MPWRSVRGWRAGRGWLGERRAAGARRGRRPSRPKRAGRLPASAPLCLAFSRTGLGGFASPSGFWESGAGFSGPGSGQPDVMCMISGKCWSAARRMHARGVARVSLSSKGLLKHQAAIPPLPNRPHKAFGYAYIRRAIGQHIGESHARAASLTKRAAKVAPRRACQGCVPCAQIRRCGEKRRRAGFCHVATFESRNLSVELACLAVLPSGNEQAPRAGNRAQSRRIIPANCHDNQWLSTYPKKAT